MLTGTFTNEEPKSTDTDDWCLNHNIASIVAVALDRTVDLSTMNSKLSQSLKLVKFE
ncbi:MAG: hypothetical protein J6V60_04685 [Muribaculaceae bacterium]|nr:hypothetical protein [Muribaculaceae bacterium]